MPADYTSPWAGIALEGAVIVVSILLAFALDAWWDERNESARVEEMLDAVASEAEDPHRQRAAFFRHALAGEAAAVEALPMDGLVQGLTNEYLLRMIADGYALPGRHADAVRALRGALGRGFINSPNLSARAVTLESLRATEEFKTLLAEIEPRWRALVEWEKGLGA